MQLPEKIKKLKIESKMLTKIYHADLNVSFIEENAIQIKIELTINVDTSATNIKKRLYLESFYM